MPEPEMPAWWVTLSKAESNRLTVQAGLLARGPRPSPCFQGASGISSRLQWRYRGGLTPPSLFFPIPAFAGTSGHLNGLRYALVRPVTIDTPSATVNAAQPRLPTPPNAPFMRSCPSQLNEQSPLRHVHERTPLNGGRPP